jgi:Arc/MetJ family transcription regulator
MRTNIDLDDKLVGEALKLTGLKTKKAVVEEGLKLLVRREGQKKLMDYFGKLPTDPDYDYKSMRR